MLLKHTGITLKQDLQLPHPSRQEDLVLWAAPCRQRQLILMQRIITRCHVADTEEVVFNSVYPFTLDIAMNWDPIFLINGRIRLARLFRDKQTQ